MVTAQMFTITPLDTTQSAFQISADDLISVSGINSNADSSISYQINNRTINQGFNVNETPSALNSAAETLIQVTSFPSGNALYLNSTRIKKVFLSTAKGNSTGAAIVMNTEGAAWATFQVTETPAAVVILINAIADTAPLPLAQHILATTQSTSTSTGAFIVDGGVGIVKDVFIGGKIDVAGAVVNEATTDSTTSTTGAITTAGGVGVAKALFVGTTVNAGTSATVGTSLNVGTNQTFSKEVDHTVTVTTTTTAATAGGAIAISAATSGTSGSGGAASLTGGIGGTTGTGGALNLTSGAGGSASGNSGAVNVKSGNETATDSSGALTVASGTTASATSGAVTVATGAVATSGNSGVLDLASGASSTSGNSGTVTLESGAAASGTSGIVTVKSGSGTTASGKITNSTGSATTTSGLIELLTGAATTTTGAINATTGNATTTSGAIALTTGTAVTAGNITLQPGVASSTTVASIVIQGSNSVKKPVATSTVATSGTALGIDLVNGYLAVTGATGNVQLPTAAQITTAIGATPAGTTFDFIVNTSGMTAANVATLVVGANMVTAKQTGAGDSATDQLLTVTNSTALKVGVFRITFDTATTVVLFRIG
jgi:hypothetical protein